jgi:Mitochondrial ribosomal protein (VAR1)
MHNSGNIKRIWPLIFTKKFKNNKKIIPLNNNKNILGPTRYFPPVSQEWHSNIYAYNNIYTKSITVSDKNLGRLIKGYFNLYFSKKRLYYKRFLTKFRRLIVNKVFISKAELKHTSSKVIITLYVYNEERRTLLNRIKRIESILFPSIKFISNKNKILSLKKKLDLIKKVKEKFSFISWLNIIINYIVEEKKLEEKCLETINKSKLRSKKIKEIEVLEGNIKNIFTIISDCENDPIFHEKYNSIYNKFLNKTILEKEIVIITYFKLLLNLNKYKFEDKFILKLKPFISKIYNKEVEFNVVNLKAVYLNSDIFTQAISQKLRNRNNRLLTILKYFLYMIKLPKVNLLKERFTHVNIGNLWVNRISNLTIEALSLNNPKDNINQLLIDLFPTSNFLRKLEVKETVLNDNISKSHISNDLLFYVLNTLKYKNMAGVRLEAKGRLTRRLTASRSVFKIKWKGSLKNIDSSYKGLSSVILRGHVKSNIQYSIIKSKTRNGAFGLKGWISGK